MKQEKDISVVIPLGGRCTWEDNELKYCLRSLEKNFNFTFDVTIYTNRPINWIKNATIIDTPRYYPEQLIKRFDGKKRYENYYDTLNKLKRASQNNDLTSDILYVYDDILLLKKQDFGDIQRIYAGGKYEDNKDYWNNPGRNKWKNTIHEAIKRSRAYGQVFLYETHLPRYFDRYNLCKMFSRYPIDKLEIPYAPATLYYNMFYNKPHDIYVDKKKQGNKVKAGFYGAQTLEGDSFPSINKDKNAIKEYISDKVWMNYNEPGLTDVLKEVIHEMFPKKSKFEK